MSMIGPDDRVLTASAVISATGADTEKVDISHARVVEVWITVTAVDGAGDYSVHAQTGLADAVATTAAHWKTQKSVLNIVAIGTYAVTLCRETENLGRNLHLSWTKNSGTSITMSTRVIIRET